MVAYIQTPEEFDVFRMMEFRAQHLQILHSTYEAALRLDLAMLDSSLPRKAP
jgi:hypothetical protein